jgi:hypothetical protein
VSPNGVGASVGWGVEPTHQAFFVGAAVGCTEGFSVGAAVGLLVCEEVGLFVGFSDGFCETEGAVENV